MNRNEDKTSTHQGGKGFILDGGPSDTVASTDPSAVSSSQTNDGVTAAMGSAAAIGAASGVIGSRSRDDEKIVDDLSDPQASGERDFEQTVSPSRRRAAKAIIGSAAVATGTLLLPGRWERPTVEGVFLPTHAQASHLGADVVLGYNTARSLNATGNDNYIIGMQVTATGGGLVTHLGLVTRTLNTTPNMWLAIYNNDANSDYPTTLVGSTNEFEVSVVGNTYYSVTQHSPAVESGKKYWIVMSLDEDWDLTYTASGMSFELVRTHTSTAPSNFPAGATAKTQQYPISAYVHLT